jgi:hypothetical protein
MSARRLKLCQALVGRQASLAQISGSTSRVEEQARRIHRARMHFICELMQILLNGAKLVSMRIQSCNQLRLSLVHVQLFNDRTSAHSREGFRALRSHYEDRYLIACEGSLCALLAIEQCYNAVTVRLRCPKSAGGSYDPITTRWPFPPPKHPCL